MLDGKMPHVCECIGQRHAVRIPQQGLFGITADGSFKFDVIRLVVHPLDVLKYYERVKVAQCVSFPDTFTPDQMKYLLLFLDDRKQLCL